MADDDGQTPLFIAARRGHAEVVELLLQARADKERARNDGTTPLSIAAQAASRNGYQRILQLLVDAGQIQKGQEMMEKHPCCS